MLIIGVVAVQYIRTIRETVGDLDPGVVHAIGQHGSFMANRVCAESC